MEHVLLLADVHVAELGKVARVAVVDVGRVLGVEGLCRRITSYNVCYTKLLRG